jgi:amidase
MIDTKGTDMTADGHAGASDAPRSLVATLIASRGDAQAVAARLEDASARAAQCEPWLKAFVHRADMAVSDVSAPGITASTQASERKAIDVDALAALPLAGTPVAIKDLMDTADMPTTYGSPIYANHRPAADAWITARIRAHGGVVFGKTVTTEFAWREPGPTVNPWNRLHSPGGSSSGSAAAVGAGIVPLATGTQTVGSVIRPAAYCGVVGYKPSYGKIPTTGVHPLSHTLDHIGFFARKVEDAALAHALFIDEQPHAIASAQRWNDYFAAGVDRAKPTLAVIRTPLWSSLPDVQKDNFNTCLQRLAAAGATLVERDFDVMPDTLAGVQTLLAVEANAAIGPTARAHPTLISRHMAVLTEEGATISDARYQAALGLREQLRAGFHDFLDGCDAIVTVPAAGGAPLGLTHTGDASFCAPWSFIGAPAVTIPSGFTADGLPLGLQIVGDIGNDLRTLQTAAWLENIVG